MEEVLVRVNINVLLILFLLTFIFSDYEFMLNLVFVHVLLSRLIEVSAPL